MAIRILLVLMAMCWITAVTASGDSFNLYLVRHAEKQLDGSRDPALTAAGQQRSKQLATWLSTKEIHRVWSSDYKRTRDTAAPLLDSSGLELAIYDPRNQGALAGKLLREKQHAVIVGHSNTVPELARLLCDCDVAEMEESEYDRLIVVTVSTGKVSVETLQQHQLFEP